MKLLGNMVVASSSHKDLAEIVEHLDHQLTCNSGKLLFSVFEEQERADFLQQTRKKF
jgi:hypothetical protein